jgi:hypothetical protein|tara:strand:- start:1185 stop:1340 length:156 start_codon:yes stop_codon:yes gene_type:complete
VDGDVPNHIQEMQDSTEHHVVDRVVGVTGDPEEWSRYHTVKKHMTKYKGRE